MPLTRGRRILIPAPLCEKSYKPPMRRSREDSRRNKHKRFPRLAPAEIQAVTRGSTPRMGGRRHLKRREFVRCSEVVVE